MGFDPFLHTNSQHFCATAIEKDYVLAMDRLITLASVFDRLPALFK